MTTPPPSPKGSAADWLVDRALRGLIRTTLRMPYARRVPFMGKLANTVTSAADIAIKLDALVVPYFGTRRADGLSFDVDIQSPIKHTAPTQMMQDITDRLTDKVTENPDQWFCFHRRWKNAP